MFYEPKKGHPFIIDPYKSLIFPRPIGWISTISKKGIPNLAPYSYFNAVADHPPQVMFSEEASISSNKYKDSLTNILSTKEFVVNFATSKICKQMALSSIDAPSDIDEFKFTKLKKRKSKKVKAPSVAESPVNLECKLLKTFKLKSNSNKYGTIVIGEVIKQKSYDDKIPLTKKEGFAALDAESVSKLRAKHKDLGAISESLWKEY